MSRFLIIDGVHMETKRMVYEVVQDDGRYKHITFCSDRAEAERIVKDLEEKYNGIQS